LAFQLFGVSTLCPPTQPDLFAPPSRSAMLCQVTPSSAVKTIRPSARQPAASLDPFVAPWLLGLRQFQLFGVSGFWRLESIPTISTAGSPSPFQRDGFPRFGVSAFQLSIPMRHSGRVYRLKTAGSSRCRTRKPWRTRFQCRPPGRWHPELVEARTSRACQQAGTPHAEPPRQTEILRANPPAPFPGFPGFSRKKSASGRSNPSPADPGRTEGRGPW